MNGSGKLYSLLITYCIHVEQSLEKVPQNVDLLLALLQSGSQIGGLVRYSDLVCPFATSNHMLGYMST